MSAGLSQLEREVYLYLIDHLTEHAYQPSVRDIARQFSIKSTRTVSQILRSLAEKGYIRRTSLRSRALQLEGISGPLAMLPIPAYSRLASARPAVREENRDGYLTFERRFVPNDEVFVVRIGADAAEGANGILPGDYLLIDPISPAQDGATVLARVGERAMVRSITHRGARIVLLPWNAEQPEVIGGPDADFEIVGVVCALLRSVIDRAIGQPEH